jgi:DNA-directed RNA polymerase specialized sigma24 family protein
MSAPRTEAQAFTELGESALFQLEPAELLAYLAQAKRAGRVEAARTAMHMLLFRYEEPMRARVRTHLPRHLQHHSETVADWAVDRVMQSALALELRGESVGEWVNYWRTGIRRQVTSFWRTKQGKALERERDMPAREAAAPFDEDRLTARLDAERTVAAVLDAMSNLEHVAIVRGAFWDDRSSADLAAEHGKTVDNVEKIKSRFRQALRRRLAEGP